MTQLSPAPVKLAADEGDVFHLCCCCYGDEYDPDDPTLCGAVCDEPAKPDDVVCSACALIEAADPDYCPRGGRCT